MTNLSLRALTATALGAVALIAPAVTALSLTADASAVTSAQVTRYTTATTNIRSAASTSSTRVTSVSAGTKITGTLTNGWVKIASPTNLAGRYVSDSVLTSTAPAASILNAWAGYTRTPLLTSAGASAGTIAANTPLTGKLSGSYFVITTGTYAGKKVSKYDVMWTNPAKALTGDATKVSSKAPVGQTVTRHLVSTLDYNPALRTSASTHATLIARVKPGTSFVGHYVNSGWFKITSGSYAGRYISADLLHTTSSMSAVNGRIPSADLCQMPSWMNTNWSPTTPRTLQCNALAGLKELNTAFKAKFGYDLDLDEGYRDLGTQSMYYKVYGYPSAAMPGTSNHGYGRAIDLLGTRSAMLLGTKSPYRFGTAEDAWLTANSKAYGWDRPDQFDKNGSNPEYWHYNWIG